MNHIPKKGLVPSLLLIGVLLAAVLAFVPKALAEDQGSVNEASAASLSSSSASSESSTSTLEFQTADQIIGKRLGSLAGGAFDTLMFKNYEGVTQQDFSYYNSNAETVQALKSKKIDAMITDLP